MILMNEDFNHFKLKTLEGLKQIIIFYTMMFITSTIVIIIFSMDETYQFSFILFPVAIVSLLSLLGIYFSIRKIYKGNKGFGAAHEKSTLTARKLISWGIVIYFIGSFLSAPFSISS